MQEIEKKNIKVLQHRVVAPRDDFEQKNVKIVTNLNLSGGKKFKVRMTGGRVWKIKAVQNSEDTQYIKKPRGVLKNLLKLEKPPKDLYSQIIPDENQQVTQQAPAPPPVSDVKSNTKVKLNIKAGKTSVQKTGDQSGKDADSKNVKSTKGDNKGVEDSQALLMNELEKKELEALEDELIEEVEVVKRFPVNKESSEEFWYCQFLHITIDKNCQISRFCLFKNLNDF